MRLKTPRTKAHKSLKKCVERNKTCIVTTYLAPPDPDGNGSYRVSEEGMKGGSAKAIPDGLHDNNLHSRRTISRFFPPIFDTVLLIRGTRVWYVARSKLARSTLCSESHSNGVITSSAIPGFLSHVAMTTAGFSRQCSRRSSFQFAYFHAPNPDYSSTKRSKSF